MLYTDDLSVRFRGRRGGERAEEEEESETEEEESGEEREEDGNVGWYGVGHPREKVVCYRWRHDE